MCKEGEFGVCRFADGTICWAFANVEPGWTWNNTNAVAPLNTWSHVVVTYDAGNVRTYLNGSLAHSYSGSGSIGTYDPSLHDLRLGARQAGPQHFQGLLEDICVYRVAIDAATVAALADIVKSPRLVAHWKLDEGQGSQAHDASGNGLHGTLDGPTWTVGRVGNALSFNRTKFSTDSVQVRPDRILTSIVNDFTIAFWANPAIKHMVYAEANSGTDGINGARYAFGPEQGGTTHGADHAGVGISVGTNGVSVYEYSDDYLPPLLVYEGAITQWTHIAVVYENRQPRLYLNGRCVKTGLASPSSFIHAVLQDLGGMAYGYYAGDLDNVRIYNQPLSAADVVALAAGLEDSEARYYCETAYEALLTRLGTSYEEVRLARGAELEERENLATRLGISLDSTRPDQLDELLLRPDQITESVLESLCGLVDTRRDPLQPVPAPKLLTWRLDRLRAMWLQQDHVEAAGTAALPLIIDPDVIGRADLRNPVKTDAAYDVWDKRRRWLKRASNELKVKRVQYPAPEEALNAVLEMTFRHHPPAKEVWKIADEQQHGSDIRPALADLHLTPRMFRRLLRIRALAQTGIVTDDEWADVDDILLGVQKAHWKQHGVRQSSQSRSHQINFC